MRTGHKPNERQKVHKLNENELLSESERLEQLLKNGKLSIADGRRLTKIREGLQYMARLKSVL